MVLYGWNECNDALVVLLAELIQTLSGHHLERNPVSANQGKQFLKVYPFESLLYKYPLRFSSTGDVFIYWPYADYEIIQVFWFLC